MMAPMYVIAGFALFIAAAFVIYRDWRQEQAMQRLVDAQNAERQAWTAERRELISRITHPQMMPVAAPKAALDPSVLAEARGRRTEMAKIGRVPLIPANGGDADDLPGVP